MSHLIPLFLGENIVHRQIILVCGQCFAVQLAFVGRGYRRDIGAETGEVAVIISGAKAKPMASVV